MRKRLTTIAVGALLVLAVYLAGWLPERGRRIAAEERAAALQGQRDDAQVRLRAATLLGDVLALEEVVANRNYGQAEQLASSFFDAVAEEASRAPDGSVRSALTDVQGRRDGVTAALARTDPEVATILKTIEVRLRRGLGFRLTN